MHKKVFRNIYPFYNTISDTFVTEDYNSILHQIYEAE